MGIKMYYKRWKSKHIYWETTMYLLKYTHVAGVNSVDWKIREDLLQDVFLDDGNLYS